MSGAAAPASPDVERELATDLAKRGLLVLPALVLIGAFARGGAGGASAAFAVGIVLVNFSLAAALLSWAARRSLNLLMAVALGGFLVRMVLIAVVLGVVRHQAWVDVPTLGITIVVTHLGLLVWETRYVSASLAFPGLKPRPGLPARTPSPSPEN